MGEVGEDEDPGDSNCNQHHHIEQVGYRCYHHAGGAEKERRSDTLQFLHLCTFKAKSAYVFISNGHTCEYVSTDMNPARTPPPTRRLPSPSHVPTGCLGDRRQRQTSDCAINEYTIYDSCMMCFLCEYFSPGPVSQVEENCRTLGLLLTNRPDSPIHQKGLSPNSILGTNVNHSTCNNLLFSIIQVHAATCCTTVSNIMSVGSLYSGH